MHQKLTILAAAMAVAVSSCSSDSSSEISPDSCGIELAETSSQPFGRVEFVPTWDFESNSNPQVFLETSEIDERFITPMAEVDGVWYLSAPIHPAGPQGGEYEVVLGNDSVRCSTRATLTIEPLPEAGSDHAAEAREKIFDLTSALFARAGVDRTLLREQAVLQEDGTFALEDPRLVPFAVLDHVIGTPEEPGGYIYILEGMDGEVREEFNRLVEADPTLIPSDDAIEALIPAPVPNQFLFSSHQIVEQAEINSPEDLASRMQLSETFCSRVRGPFSSWVTKTSTALSPLAGNQYVGAALASFSVSAAVFSAIAGLVCGTQPRVFTDLETVPSHLMIEEDWLEGKMYSEIITTSKPETPFNVVKALWDITTALVDLLPGAKKKPERLDFFEDKLGDLLLEAAGTTGEEAVENVVKSAVGTLSSEGAKHVTEDLGALGDVFIGEDFEWEVDIARGDYVLLTSKKRYTAQASCPRSCLKAIEVGDDIVTVFPRLEIFQNAYSEEFPASVNAIKPDLGEPEIRLAEPGEQKTIEWEVKHAEKYDLEWKYSWLPMTSEMTDEKTGIMSGFELPEEEDAFPVVVSAISRSEQGLRRPELNPPPRIGTVIYKTGDVEITESQRCFRPGEKKALAHSVRDIPNAEVETSWEPGNLVDDDGEFTAPSAPGRYDVTIKAEWNDGIDIVEKEDTETFVVDEFCFCRHDIDTYGAVNKSWHDFFKITQTVFFDSPNLLVGEPGIPEIILSWESAEIEVGVFPAEFYVVDQETRKGAIGPGTLEVTEVLTIPSADEDDDEPEGIVYFTEFQAVLPPDIPGDPPTFMTGKINHVRTDGFVEGYDCVSETYFPERELLGLRDDSR